MKNVFDAAKYILEKTGPITTMKLQKLLYYAQAWSLVWDEEELFPEEFEAWSGGPVCPELYSWHKHMYRVSADQVPADRLSGEPFSDDQSKTLAVVLETYGDKSGRWLSGLTHTEDPWKQARGSCLPGDYCSNVISKGDMAWYYEQYSG